MKRLVKYICSVLLAVLALTMVGNQGNTAWQEAMPQSGTSQCFQAEQPAAERTINHLFNERIAMPIHTAGEIPGYHPQHSKPKCLQTADRLNRFNSSVRIINGFAHHRSPIHHHVIDYYIYTLEHILI